MSLGNEVNKSILDTKCAEAALYLRSAFEKVENIAKWLSNHPVDGENDPLVTEFGYNSDEAYALRLYFETFDNVRNQNGSAFDTGRKMTGLE